MTRRQSLRQALARRWMAFAAALSLLFAGATLLLLFVLEDSFIDRRLRAVAASPAVAQGATAALPAQFRVLGWQQLADAEQRRLEGLRTGAVAEFRRDDGRYVHVLRLPDAHGRRVLVHDVTDELTVNPGLSRGLLYALAVLALALLCAHLLARAFVAGSMRRAQALLDQVRASPDPAHLHALAEHEPVAEFAELLRLHAEVWRTRHEAVERERETLAFLAHELRTPLQSALTSLALLEESVAATPALPRLRRALSRLERTGNAVLWLSSDAAVAGERVHAASAVEQLVEEFRPLAAVRGQSFVLRIAPELQWQGPCEVIDTLLANLLLNAIQHGDAGVIELEADGAALVVRNPVAAEATPGFGMGMTIAQRLAARIGWRLDFECGHTDACCRLAWRSNEAPASPQRAVRCP